MYTFLIASTDDGYTYSTYVKQNGAGRATQLDFMSATYDVAGGAMRMLDIQGVEYLVLETEHDSPIHRHWQEWARR